jgi:hypothetical protein
VVYNAKVSILWLKIGRSGTCPVYTLLRFRS